MRLTSTHNPLIKYVRSLERAAVRRERGEYVVEGVRLAKEALASGQEARVLLYDRMALQRSTDGAAVLRDLTAWAHESYDVDAHVLKAATQTEHPSGVLVLVPLPVPPPLSAQGDGPFGVVLDTVSDPGNAGTIIRTARAVGADYVISTANSVDLFGPKVVRAGMGAHFTLPLYSGVPWAELEACLSNTHFVAAAAASEQTLYRFAWPERCVLVIGSEAHGLSVEAAASIDSRVRIPMMPGVESLNASVAASILMYAARAPILALES